MPWLLLALAIPLVAGLQHIGGAALRRSTRPLRSAVLLLDDGMLTPSEFRAATRLAALSDAPVAEVPVRTQSPSAPLADASSALSNLPNSLDRMELAGQNVIIGLREGFDSRSVRSLMVARCGATKAATLATLRPPWARRARATNRACAPRCGSCTRRRARRRARRCRARTPRPRCRRARGSGTTGRICGARGGGGGGGGGSKGGEGEGAGAGEAQILTCGTRRRRRAGFARRRCIGRPWRRARASRAT